MALEDLRGNNIFYEHGQYVPPSRLTNTDKILPQWEKGIFVEPFDKELTMNDRTEKDKLYSWDFNDQGIQIILREDDEYDRTAIPMSMYL